jgi:hypothetical protein
MKRMIVALVGLVVLGAAAAAQPRAIGVRAGWSGELSFQYTTKDFQFLEVDLGSVNWGENYNGFKATATYNFIFSQPQWTPRGEWAWYAGVGPMLGVAHVLGHHRDKDGEYEPPYNYFLLCAAPVFGLEYTFWFPLQLSVDIRPPFGFSFGRGDYRGFYLDGMIFGFIPSLSVRYRF